MALGIVQQIQLSDTAGFGPVTRNLANTTGNALVAIVVVGTWNVQGNLPRLAVADDAHNWWIFSGTRTVILAGQNRRVDIWVAPNARRADPFFGTNVSVCSSQIYAGFAGSIIEVSGFPTFATVDFVAVASGSGTSAALSGSATTADYMFGALLLSATGSSLAPAVTDPAGWTPLTTAGGGNTNTDMSNQWLFPAYNTVAAGAVSATYTWTGTFDYAAVMVGFQQVPAAPPQPNPDWPYVKVEAAFGWSPGDLTGTMPTWTDITFRAQDTAGKTVMSTTRGRDFELSQPAAGDSTILFDNHDSALNPVNPSSPYYPNVRPEVPVRASAIWNGRQTGLGFLYANKWPQSFPDPQWGMSEFAGTDAIGIASQGQMPSAYGGQVLADYPYCSYPLSEFFSNAHGQLFANQSRTNLKPMIGFSSTLQTGLTMGLQGDSGTGIGISGLSAFIAASQGSGAILRDQALPNIGTGSDVTIEFWAAGWNPGGLVTTPLPPYQQLLALTSLPTNYVTGSVNLVGDLRPGQRFVVYYLPEPGSPAVDQFGWYLAGPQGVAFGSFQGGGLTTGVVYHFVFTIHYNGTQYVVTSYINGVVQNTTNVAANSPLEITGMLAGSASPFNGAGFTGNFTVGQVAIYPWLLPAARIAAHYATGSNADSSDGLLRRLGRLAAYSGLSLPVMGAGNSPSPLLGNNDQMQGAPLADALYATSVDEGGFYYAPADSTGCIWYANRTSFYNRSPKFTFGDRPDIAVTPPWGITPWSFTTSGTPANNGYFTVTNAQAASVNVGDQFSIGGSGAYVVISIGPPAFGFNNIFFIAAYSSVIPAGTTVTQFFGEIPVDYGSGFDYSDAYLFNIISSLRTISSATQFIAQGGQEQTATFNAYGVDAVVADLASEAQYMPRGPQQFPIETTSDQDAYDKANWALTKYRQPQLRANQILLHAASNPSIFTAALAVEQGDIVAVNRRPAGGAVISLNCVVQKVEHDIGPSLWDVTLTLAPYYPEGAVIQLDNASFDQLQDGVLGW